MTPHTNGGRRRGSARGVTMAAVLLITGSLTACGPADSGLRQDTARQFQERVLAVSQAAAGNDPAGALAALEALEADLAAATSAGDVSEDRRRSITTAAAAVRADLNEAVAAAAKAAEDAAAAQRQAEIDAAAAEAAKVAPAPAPVPAPPAQGGSKGNAGKGKGKDD